MEATGSGLSEGDVFKTGGGCFEAAEERGEGTDTCSPKRDGEGQRERGGDRDGSKEP